MKFQFFFCVSLTSASIFRVKNEVEVSYNSSQWDDIDGFLDSVYSELATISCNNFTDCQVEYRHANTNETTTINVTETQKEAEEIEYIILTGRFPPLLPETCESAAISMFSDQCPGIVQLDEDQRPIMDLQWPRLRPSTISLKDFKPDENFDFQQRDNEEYFHIHKTSHLIIGNINYLIGGERYYDALSEITYFDKEFNRGVWELQYDMLKKTNIENNFNISRAASAVRLINGVRENGFICGSLLHPDQCFVFDGKTLELRPNRMKQGHTDEAAMIDTEKFGLFIVGGGQNPFYLNNKGDQDGTIDRSRHGIVETNWAGYDWSETRCAAFPHMIVGTTVLELGSKIWLFGGHSGSPKDWVYYMDTTDGKCDEWRIHPRSLLAPRSGHSAVVNRVDNTLMLVGNSLSGMNKPIEMWTFNPSWSSSTSLINQFNSTFVTNNSSYEYVYTRFLKYVNYK